MTVSALSEAELARRLGGTGLRLRTGPVVNRIHCRHPGVAEGVRTLYADHEVEDEGGFADFDVALVPPRGLRRWLRPQILFQFDNAPPFHPLPADQAFATLEWGLNWCVSAHCHQYLIVHAAVVERRGRALLLPAPPGSGKSTLCAGLVSRGWRLLSDELALIDPLSGGLVPLPRPISLKNASIEVIRRFVPDAVLGRTAHDTVKGSVAHLRPPASSVQRAAVRAAPRWIAQPRYQAGSRAGLTRFAKGRAFMQLADSAFNYHLHGRAGFELLARIVESCDCYEFAYGDLHEAVNIFERLAEAA